MMRRNISTSYILIGSLGCSWRTIPNAVLNNVIEEMEPYETTYQKRPGLSS